MYVCVHVSPLTELYIMVQDKHPFMFFRTTLEMKKILLFPIYERYYIDPIKIMIFFYKLQLQRIMPATFSNSKSIRRYF